MSRAELAYAQARLQARYGARPGESTWRRLRASASLPHFLEAARASELRPWLTAIHARSRADEIEQALQRAFAAEVREVASWLPEAWRPAFDFVLDSGTRQFGDAWLKEFRATWPRMQRQDRDGLQRFTDALLVHHQRMANCPETSDGWEIRAGLERETVRRFRLHAERPTAAFCFLALVLLDLERLRGALLRRLLFADVGSEGSWV